MDFDEEGRKLFEKLGLPDPTVKIDDSKYCDKPNIVWVHPETQAKLYVGDEYAAKTLSLLEEFKLFNIICTKGATGPLYHIADPRFTYLPFHIESLTRLVPHI